MQKYTVCQINGRAYREEKRQSESLMSKTVLFLGYVNGNSRENQEVICMKTGKRVSCLEVYIFN